MIYKWVVRMNETRRSDLQGRYGIKYVLVFDTLIQVCQEYQTATGSDKNILGILGGCGEGHSDTTSINRVTKHLRDKQILQLLSAYS
jgi:hypothetical protein